MRRHSFIQIITFIMAFFIIAGLVPLEKVNAQFKKEVTPFNNSILLTYTATLDSGQTVTAKDGFSLGYYDHTNYPVHYETVVTKTGANNPKITTFLDKAYDNVTWTLKSDTLARADSVLTPHDGDLAVHKQAPYFRPVAKRTDTTSGRAYVKWTFWIKKE